ncbi:MAG TPA: amino acid adenylation domain-containing protein, partial [Pyrinomonadaceae bacterium]|nr:amino acid adenylation domain-containing protein [Pyrinomonadaceae bacterium]
LLLAGFQALLSRYTGQNDIAVGTDVANRTLLETEDLIGFFINQLVLRTQITPATSFREMLRLVRETTLESYAHQELPFEKLVEELAPERHLDRSPLFQVKLILQNAPQSDLALGDMNLSQMPIQQPEARFDVVLSLVESPGGIGGNVEYAAGLYDELTIVRMMDHLEVLLESAIAAPDTPVRNLNMTTPAEVNLLLEYGATKVEAQPSRGGVHEMFAQQVMRTPHAVAVVDQGRPYLYLEVEMRANRLANYLRGIGVGPDVRVGLFMERSLDLAVAMLGVLKAGGAYVPLNQNWPATRIAHVLDDAAIPVLLVHEHLRDRLPMTWATTISIDADWPDVAAQDAERPSVEVHPEMLAYVIYTSGSTGQPKGVMVSHGALASRVSALAEMYELVPEDRFSQFIAPSFDPFGLEFYPTLSRGASIAFEPNTSEMTGRELVRLLKDREVTVSLILPAKMEEVTAAVRELPEDERPSLRLLLSGGEAATVAGVAAWHDAFNAPTLHQYGPTEATILASAYACNESSPVDHETTRSLLGDAIAETQLYVMDEDDELSPLGVSGELYIGGAGVARGYLNRAGLTAERFVPDLFSGVEGARLYRTGDVVRWRADGELEFLGRRDHQVKLRGYRIELGEIEGVLAQHPLVQQCVVVIRDLGGNATLIAYVVGSVETVELREYLSQQLPAYMVPQRIVSLESLPLTSNGKVDRKALPEPGAKEVERSGQRRARTPMEELLCGIWAEVLGRAEAGIDENFFELGGHSLLATQVVARIRAVFGIEIPLRILFEGPTVEAVAVELGKLKQTQAAPVPELVRVPRDGTLPLSFGQQRLWFLNQLETNNPAYNVQLAVRLDGELDVAALNRALSEIVRRHEVLRTTFPTVDGIPVQQIAEAVPLSASLIDLRHLDRESGESVASEVAGLEASRPFNLAAGPLLRAMLMRLSDQEHVLVVVMHHIAADAGSLSVLSKEFGLLYEAYRRGLPSPLAELKIQYADYAVWQREWLGEALVNQQLQYWRQQLEGLQHLELPADMPRPAISTGRGGMVHFEIDQQLAEQLRQLSRREGVTLFMTLTAAFQLLLSKYSGQQDVAIGTVIANRNRVEIEPLVGLFINQLVLRTRFDRCVNVRDLLGQVRENVLGAYAHQDLPFERLVDEISPERDLSRSPLFQAMFFYEQHQANVPARTADNAQEDEQHWAKFDLTLMIDDTPAGLGLRLEYAADLFHRSTVERLAKSLCLILETMSAQSQQRLSRLSVIDEAQRLLLTAGYNQTELPYESRLMHQFFEAQAARTPERTAITCCQRSMSYGELNQRAEALAECLIELGAGPEQRIAVCFERGPELMVALLAVLKTGSAYVPIDPEYPIDRINYVLEDSEAIIVLTQCHLTARLPEQERPVLCIDEDVESVEAVSDISPGRCVPANTAYVIYTSGSTGLPKGVAITHDNVANFFAAMDEKIGPRGEDGKRRWLAVTTVSFDISVLELFWTLGRGFEVVLERAPQQESIAATIREHEITHLQCTPSLGQMLLTEARPADLQSLAALLLGGEALPGAQVAQLRQSYSGPLYNMY